MLEQLGAYAVVLLVVAAAGATIFGNPAPPFGWMKAFAGMLLLEGFAIGLGLVGAAFVWAVSVIGGRG